MPRGLLVQGKANDGRTLSAAAAGHVHIGLGGLVDDVVDTFDGTRHDEDELR